MTVKTEKLRGIKEGRGHFAMLSKIWPKAFPQKSHLVRPLSSDVISEISKELGWSNAYTRAVLGVWKLQDRYCNAILNHNDRIRLDGSPSEQTVSDDARATAKARLEQIAANKIARAARAARLQEQQQEAPQTA